MSYYASLTKAVESLQKAIMENAAIFWKASTIYRISVAEAQKFYRQKALEIEADIILHGGVEAVGLGGGTVEQLTQALSPEVKPLVEAVKPPPPPTPPPPEMVHPAKAVMEGLLAIPKAVIPLPENVRILFEKPLASLAEAIRLSPQLVKEVARQTLTEDASKMAEASMEMLSMANRISQALSLKTPVTVEGLTVPPERAMDSLRNAYLAGYNILLNFIEALSTLTEHNPLTAEEQAKIIDSLTQTTANITQIRQMTDLPPRTLPPTKIKTIYGYEYICPICGAVYYSQAEIEAHMRATGHGTL